MKQKNITGLRKMLLYALICSHAFAHYVVRPQRFSSPLDFVRFLRRALTLLLVFRHNGAVRVPGGYKIHLYLPAYPSPAFFRALEAKLLRTPPGPTTVVFSMTRACAYRCKHCYQRLDTAPDISEELMLDTATRVRDAGVAMFDIEGGEPFLLYERLKHLVAHVADGCEVWVNTTGDKASRERLEQLKQLGLFGIMVSIHSPAADTHDALTGISGSFEVARRVLDDARSIGIVTALNSVLDESEIAQDGIDELMQFARECECQYVQLIHPKPAGAWIGRKDAMQKDESVLAKVRRQHLEYNRRGRKGFPLLAAQVFEESADQLGCTAGAIDRFYIGAAGDVQPCEFLNLSFGNVNEESFETIMERMRNAFPEPRTDWLCCTQADAICQCVEKHQLTRTPIPWQLTQEIVSNWNRGEPTPIYQQLEIYR